jgi:CRP/FNR family cyclic AMP-dependent transcriptional regulator
MMEVTASVLGRQRFLHGMRTEQLDALAAMASEAMFPAGHRIFAEGGYTGSFWLIESGHVTLDVQVPGREHGWSWLLPPYQWAFGAVCVTEVKAIEFSAAAVRERCAADPALGYELTRRLYQVLAERLQNTRARLIAKSAA